jgi:NTP pyrophosphatase (non-canonical NTP hydrolase)
MKNLNNVAEQLFNEIRGRFPSVEIGDANGNVVNEPQTARFYDFDFETNGKKLGKVSVSLDEEDGIVIMFNKNFIEEQYGSAKSDWYGFLKNIRTFSKKRLLNFEVRDINRTNLTKRDYKFLAANRRGEQTMAESRMYGSAKTSFQKIGNAKLSIKHTGAIQEGSSRTQKIGAIYIENTDGERFKYPFKHLSGARALAVHVSEGGHPYDDFGKYITGLSEELSNLRKFKQYMARSSVMAESLSEHMDTVNERVALVKKEIQNLQKPSYYTNAFENFVPIENEEVPEDIAANWIDQLTVKQFNEELKDVFPYIYNLVSEATKAKELSFEDIIAEQAQNFITYQVQPGDTITSIVNDMNAEGIETTVDQVMMDNKGVVDSKGNVKAGTVLKIGEPQLAPTTSIRPQGRPETVGIGGTTEIAPNGQIDGSTRGIDPALNYGESIEKTIDKLMGQFSEEADDLDESGLQYYTGVKKHGKEYMKKAAQAGREGASQEELGRLKDKYSKAEKKTKEGNAFANAVRQAKMNGKKKGDKIPGPDGDEITLEKEKKIPLGEFILSYFDRESGQFPKGPTAVLTMVEKEYGDQYVRPASKFIERINQRVSEIMGYKENDFEVQETPEIERISALAGLR